MIPQFNEHGYLPPGLHRASLDEIEERFGRGTEIRRAQMQSLYWLVDLARRAGIERLILNKVDGSKPKRPQDALG